MNDQDKSREQLLAELVELRQRVAQERASPELRTAAALFQVAPLGIHECDTQGRITFVNPSQEAITGYTAGELVGTYAWDRIVPGPEKDSLPAHFKYLVAEQPAPTPFFAKNIKKSGELFDVRIDWNYVRNAQGEVTGFVCVVSDITEPKQAQLALQEARDELERRVEERTADLTRANELLQAEVQQRRQAEEGLVIFKRFADAATQGFGMADVDGRITYANPFLAQLFGAQSPDEVLGTHVSAHYPADYLPRREREIIPALRRGEHWQGEQVLLLPDGRLHPTIHTVFPVRDENGELYRTASVITDITELKRAEAELRQSYEELRQSEERYDLAARGAGVGLWDWDLLTGKVFYSPRWKMLFGYDEDEIGEGFEDWASRLHPDERDGIIKLQDEFLAGTALTATAEYRFRQQDGSYRWIIAHALVVRDAEGKACRLVGSHGDITDRKRAEEALRDSEGRLTFALEVIRQSRDELQIIYDGILEGLLITDIETKRFVRVNASLCQMLGYSEAELLAASIKDIHPAEEVSNDLRRFQAAAEGRVSINEDRPVLRKDGSIFYADITGRRIFYDERPCLLALFRDVTERREAERKLQREQQALRRMMLASDRERHMITYELHDGVAQQLVGAMLYFQAMESRLGPKSKAADAYQGGMEALRRASSEIRRVMNWLRTPVLDQFGLVAAIDDVAAQLRSASGAPEIEYQHAVTFARLEPTLENTLFRIAQEALQNACRHSQSEQVRVKLTQKGGDVTLEVRDWGIGFEPGTVRENRFGLEGIRERTRILGGKLSIKSQPGKGTVIQVKFPVIEAQGEE